MDGENNGKPYEQMDDLGGKPLFLVQHPYIQKLTLFRDHSRLKKASLPGPYLHWT